MMLPPAILDLRYPRADGRRAHLWLPLFLLWPLLLVIELLVLVPALLVDVILLMVGRRYHHYSVLLARCFLLLSETRGTVIRVKHDQTDIDMKFV